LGGTDIGGTVSKNKLAAILMEMAGHNCFIISPCFLDRKKIF